MTQYEVSDTNRTIRQSHIMDLHKSLLHQKQEDPVWIRFLRRLQPYKYRKSQSQLLKKQKASSARDLYLKQMELIDDPIFTQALMEKKKPFFRRLAEVTKLFKVIQPQTTWLTYWNISIIIIILYYFFEIGLVVFFGSPVWEAELNSPVTYTLNVIFILILFVDILIQLNTGYYLEGILIMDRVKVVNHYVKKYFFIDIVSVLIITACFFSGDMILNYFKVIFYAKIVTLNKIDIIYQKMLVFNLQWNIVYLISRQIIIVIMSTHYIGVIFFSIDYHVYSTNYYGPSTPNRCWIFTAQAYSQLIWEPWYVWYIYSFYWSLGTMTTIAYGDITPTNPIDTIYVILALVICCIQFSYVLYNIIEILMLGRAAKSERDNQNLQMQKFMKTHLISNNLSVKVKAFIEQTWNAEMYRNRAIERQMITKLPKQLRTELLLQVYEEFGIQLLAFKYPQYFMESIVEFIEQFRCSREEHIIKASQVQKYVYFLVNGKVDFYLTSKLHLKTLTETSIGVVEFYTETLPVFSVKAIEDSNLYRIQISKLLSLMRKNPLTFEIMKNITDECRQEERKCQLFNICCFVCDESSHMCMQCPNTHYIFQPLNILEISNRKKQPRQFFKRSSKRRRLKKYLGRRKSSDKWEPNQIATKYHSTLNEIYELDICNNINLNNVELFVEETIELLNIIEQSIDRLEEREEEEWNIETMRTFSIYLKDYNISNVLRKLRRNE